MGSEYFQDRQIPSDATHERSEAQLQQPPVLADEEPEERLYKIADWALDDLRSRFEKFAKRAAKLGVPAPFVEVAYSRDEPEYEEVITGVDGYGNPISGLSVPTGRIRRFHFVRILGEAPHFAGWTLLGVVERDVEALPDGPHLVHVLGDDTVIDPAWRYLGDVCDHCAARGYGRRGRKQLVIVQHEDGTRKVVGKSCVADFLGSNAPTNLANALEWLSNVDALVAQFEADSDSDAEWGARGEYRFEAVEYLGWVAINIRSYGWVPRSAANSLNQATADAALNDLCWRPSKFNKLEDAPTPPADEDKALAAKALSWARTLSPDADNNYIANVAVVAQKDAWRHKELGLGASIISAYLKDQELEIKRAERAAGRDAEKSSQYIGEIKERINIEGVVVFHRDFESNFGSTRLVKIHTTDGNVVTWWASNTLIETGNKVTGKATVKKHEEYQGVRQTIVTRASLTVIEEQA